MTEQDPIIFPGYHEGPNEHDKPTPVKKRPLITIAGVLLLAIGVVVVCSMVFS